MEWEELEQMNICPFNSSPFHDAVTNNYLDRGKIEREELARFILLLRYLALLTEQCQMTFFIPQISVCLTSKNCNGGIMSPSFYNKRMDILEGLLEEILVKSGWSYGKGKLKRRQVADIELYASNDVTEEDWKEAVFEIPGILNMEEKGFCDLCIMVCWNKRIARYYNYITVHPEEVAREFQKESVVMEYILQKMKDPYATGITFANCKRDMYVMGFFEGRSREKAVLFQNISYDFFVQAIFLHKLLNKAEEVFKLLK